MALPCGVRVSTTKKWTDELDPEGEWLEVVKNPFNQDYAESVFCRLCRKWAEKIQTMRNYNEAFVKGTRGLSVKKDNVRKHKKSEMHTQAYNLEKKLVTKDQIDKSLLAWDFLNSGMQEKNRIRKLLQISYTMAKMEMAFSLFPSIAEIERRDGVDLGETYMNINGCKEFTVCIGETLEWELGEILSTAEFFSILIDGVTDVHAAEKQLIYILTVTESGQTKTSLLRLTDVENSSAENLKQTITKALENLGVTDMKHKLIGLLADGSSVSMEHGKGLAAILCSETPWLVSVHCISHQLELSMKDALERTYFDEFIRILSLIQGLYKKSPKRLRQLQALAMVLEEDMVKCDDHASGFRWLAHKQRAVEALYTLYPAIIDHLQSIVEDAGIKSSEKAMIKEAAQMMSSFSFVIHLLHFRYLLKCLASLSWTLQSERTDVIAVLTSLQDLEADLNHFLENPTPESAQLLELAEKYVALPATENARQVKEEVVYKSISLRHVSERAITTFKDTQKQTVEAVRGCIMERLGDLKTISTLNVCDLLDTQKWPEDREALMTFGNMTLKAFVEQFQQPLQFIGVQMEDILSEWTKLKLFWNTNLPQLANNELGKEIIASSNKYPNLIHVVKIMMCLPTSTSSLEPFFAAMQRVKSDWRNRLGSRVLEHLLRIKFEGPDVEYFDPEEALSRFFSKPRRPSVVPFGPQENPRKRKIHVSELEDQPSLQLEESKGNIVKWSIC
ncbi:death domain-containing protein CRADD isoform X1 [Rhinatrema bivittatum]|uniref:death domain-containing protein CRADD isoform X1 n=1 Tax=Rhinatrema bivittatum TaxID=194408 RepID=UPI001125F03F|nr:death domain-containing protein CRADD isoform X1 [Rhinatrema bivittatum]XP_029463374.1 death domain-containing protein CRADD isoform X1 [Rhinatrema bivittatum]